MKFKKSKGFTLAEILVTLAVIGIVATLAIPSLLQDTSSAQHVIALKKHYSVFSQAFLMLQNENGGDISSIFSGSGGSGSANAMNAFATKLNIIKNCGSGTGCLHNGAFKYLNGSVATYNLDTSRNGNYGKAILSDGSMILISDNEGTCNTNQGTGPLANSVCGFVEIDVNGAKGPNTVGRDNFHFWITKTGLFPIGSHNDGYSCGPGNNYPTSDGCTAKILVENAMKY